MQTFKLLFFAILLCFGCNNSSTKDIVEEGVYASKTNKLAGLWDGFFNDEVFSLGDTLWILPESRFKILNCGSFSTGRYEQKGDSLVLYSDTTIHYNKDIYLSERKNMFKHGPSIESFYIEDNTTFTQKNSIIEEQQRKYAKYMVIKLAKISD